MSDVNRYRSTDRVHCSQQLAHAASPLLSWWTHFQYSSRVERVFVVQTRHTELLAFEKIRYTPDLGPARLAPGSSCQVSGPWLASY